MASYAEGAKKTITAKAKETYSVQLNAYTDKHNAELFALTMKSKGYNPYMVTFQGDKTWYKILIGPYPSKKKALQVVHTLSQKEKLKAILIPAVYPAIDPAPQAKSVSGKATTVDSKPSAPESSVAASVKPSPPPAKKKRNVGKRPAPKPKATQVAKAPEYDSIDVVVSLFLAWIKAWQGKDTDSYLAFYSRDFKYSGNSLQGWKESRRATLAKSMEIKIDFSDIQIVQGKDAVEISFIQQYQSDRHSDKGRKTLTWKKEGEAWRIITEVWVAT